jgi:hypothetical protein
MPTSRIQIPKALRVGFIKLIDLNESAFQELLTVLEKSRFIYVPNKLITDLLNDIKDIPKNDAKDILSSILPLYNVMLELELSAEDFVEEIGMAASEAEIDLAEPKLEHLKSRLGKLMGIKAPSITAKATSLLSEHQHVFESIRILTDIRPIFGDDPRERPTAAIITHTLRIRYLDGDHWEEFFVALDTSDIQKAIDAFERAKAKTESLRVFIDNANLPYVDEQ